MFEQVQQINDQTQTHNDPFRFLECRICAEYFKDPYTILGCMETFCKDCLFDYIKIEVSKSTVKRSVHEVNCPSCGLPLSLAENSIQKDICADQTKNELINTLFALRTDEMVDPTPFSEVSTEQERQSELVGFAKDLADYVGVIAVYWPSKEQRRESIQRLQHPYLLLPKELLVEDLAKFVAQQLDESNWRALQFMCRGAVLAYDMSLEFVFRARWAIRNMEMVLYFKENALCFD